MYFSKAKAFYLFVVLTLLLALLPSNKVTGVAASATDLESNVTTNNWHRIIVDNSDKTTLADLSKGGAHLLVDYGSFGLWQTADTLLGQVKSRASVTSQADFNTIALRGGTSINTAIGPTTVPANLAQTPSNGYQLWLVQWVGPLKNEWLAGLAKLGITPVIYMPNNAYVVWLNGSSLTQLEALVNKDPTIQWAGAYHPAYRLSPLLQGQNAPTTATTDVTVQFYDNAAVKTSLAKLQALSGKVLRQPQNILNFVNISLELPTNQLTNVAAWNDVFNIEPFAGFQKRDEVQDQIVAGNLISDTTPSGPGYLSWLASKGFPQDPTQYPIVGVVDDGIDDGSTNPLHPDFHTLGISNTNSSRLVFNLNCTVDTAADGQGGHGNINAGIVAAYNNATGYPYQDGNGYNRGLGESPYSRVGGVKIFPNGVDNDDESKCGGSLGGALTQAYNAGATITSNSYGASGSNGIYDSSSQTFDALTRNATPATAGSHPMLQVVAAGNDGSGSSTLDTPGTAKNVLTVGATESVRDNGITDGCGASNDINANNIASFSSRGPTADNRAKPDIVAPGVHIQGPASQDPGYTGSGVCNKYYPNSPNQTLYTWSTGTSHSTPAVAGAASLVSNYYSRVLNPGQMASPAMLKALLLNTPRYLNGSGSGDTLPSPNQGWGDPNLNMLFDGTARTLLDQSYVFSNTGQTYSRLLSVADNSKPLRVSLVWTDAPGSTTGNSYVNDLNLQVIINGQIYKGNNFSGAYSVVGGTFDPRNNVENVFLPAGITGTISVNVTAANIAGQADPTLNYNNQDFALVIYNGTDTNAPDLYASNISYSDAAPGGNGNGIAEPSETLTLNVKVTNIGNQTATGISSQLSISSGNATIISATSTYPDLAAGQNANNNTSYIFQVNNTANCFTNIVFIQTLIYNSSTVTQTFSIPIGQTYNGNVSSYNSNDVPKAIPDNNSTGIYSALNISSSDTLGKVTVSLNISHTYDSDLIIRLVSPQGISVTLYSNESTGANGQGFVNTVFDDDAATTIAAAQSPYTGSFKPDQPLSALNGQSINGTWQLFIADTQPKDTGTLLSWSLNLQPRYITCGIYSTTPTATPTTVNLTPTPATVTSVGTTVNSTSATATPTVIASTPTATPTPAPTVYTYNLPLLANTATTPVGNTTTYVTFQNLSANANANISVHYYGISNGSDLNLNDTLQLPPRGQKALLPAVGTGKSAGGVVTSDQPLNLVVSESLNAGGSAYNVTGSTASTLYSPLALNGQYGFTTSLVVFNAANSGNATGKIYFYDEQGNPGGNVQTFNLPPHASQPFNQANASSGLTANHAYWAKIVADDSSMALTAQVIQFGPNNFVATFNAIVPSQVQSTLYAPATFKGLFNFVTGMAIANPNNTPANLTINYYAADGTPLLPQSQSIPANGVIGVFQPNVSGLPNTVSSATISSTQPLIMTVNERGPNNVSGTYVGLASGNTSLALPVMANGFAGFVTGATVLNTGTSSATLNYQYLDANGNVIGTAQTKTLAPNASFLVYQGGVDQNLPANFFGTALLTSTQPLLVTTNALNTSNGLFYTYTEPSQ